MLKKSVWFKDDPEMNYILDKCLEGGILKEYKIETSMEKDFNFDLNAAARILNIVKANFDFKIETVTKMKKAFHVIFQDS